VCSSDLIFGKDCITQGHEIRKDIGYLPSEVFYYEKMKVIDLLKYAGSFYKKDCSKRIYELSEIMELNLNRRIEDLSYGNKKKVGIVQGLLHEPKLIVLDEPTSGLDPLMQQRFFELIKSENKKGASVFFSSHILSEVQHLCNRVAIIKGGHVIQVEDVKTLREDTYKKITLIGENIDLKTFEIEGVTELNKSDHQLDFFYKGDVNLLVNKIQSLKLKDILVENPSLEEIFMHYYK
jgi:ABC-2 type transport system ATP-binding protein